MSRLRFLSIISVALAPGCSGPDCGPMGAFEFGLTASNDQVTLVYGDLTAGPNNDCPDQSAPTVTSLTIMGTQMSNTGLFTICIARPDQLATTPQPIGSSGIANSGVIDVTGTDATCTYALDRTQPKSGTVTSTGLCDNGTNAAGFALVFDGFVGLKRTCGATVDTINVGLKGTVAVAKQP